MPTTIFQSVSVIGLGYIGLPTAAAFASRKLWVVGVEVNEQIVQTVNEGRVHIVEPDLDILVRAVVSEGYLRATTVAEPADAFIVAVPTPFQEGKKPDLRFVQAAARSIAPVLRKGNLVILESTSPVGATEQLARWLSELRPDLSFPAAAGEAADVCVAYCPERVLPGHIVRELIENDRVIGGLSPRCAARAAALYRTFVTGACIQTTARTAEMCKLTENAFRDVNIAFANELSLICDRLGVDVFQLIGLANRHPRVKILQPGPGVGGHCIAVDPWFLVDSAPEEARLIRTAREVNDSKPEWVLRKIRAEVEALCAAGRREEELTLTVLGLSFKPDIDDLRESPALQIAEELARSFRGRLLVVEPHIERLPSGLSERARQVSLQEGLREADLCCLLVPHRHFMESWGTGPVRGRLLDVTGLQARLGGSLA